MCVTYILVFFFILFVVVLTWWYSIYFSYRKRLKYFDEVNHYPLLGFLYYARSTVDFYNVLLTHTRKVGRNFWTMLGPFPVLCTSDPNIFSLILKSPRHIDKPPLYRSLENGVGNTLLLVNGNKWREQRHTLNPAFNYSLLIESIGIFNKHADQLVIALECEIEKNSFDVHSLAEKCSLRIVHESLLGMDIQDEVNEVLESLKCFLKLSVERNLKFNQFFDCTYLFTRNYRSERKSRGYLAVHLKKVLTKRKNIIDKNDTNTTTKPILIDMILKEIEFNKSEQLNVKQLGLMLAAGFDTTAHTISYALYCISKHPTVQEKLYKELLSILGGDLNQSITYRHLTEMKYLSLVIKESLRMYTTIPVYSRQLQEEVKFEKILLPKGLNILFLPYVMHSDPELYPEPAKFIPERFLPENLGSDRATYAPFGLGVRNCIGKKFAELSIKVILAKILLHYELVDVQHELCLANELSLVSKTGIKIGIKKRKHNTVN